MVLRAVTWGQPDSMAVRVLPGARWRVSEYRRAVDSIEFRLAAGRAELRPAAEPLD